MASVRRLKNDIHSYLGAIITKAHGHATEEADTLVEDTYKTFDQLMERMNEKNIEDASKHYGAVRKDLHEHKDALNKRADAL